MKTEDVKVLIDAANKARDAAYAPYSHFKVGAALLTADGKVFVGCNVENAAFSATICAERVAVAKAVSDGSKQFSAIAVVSSDGKPCAPCGVCRQVLSEFVKEDFLVIIANFEADFQILRFEDVLPMPFNLK